MKQSCLPVGERWGGCVPISKGRVNKLPLKNSIVRFRAQPDGVLLHRVRVDLVVDVLDQAVQLPPGLEAHQLSPSSEANQVPLLPVAKACVSRVVDLIFVVCSCSRRIRRICTQASKRSFSTRKHAMPHTLPTPQSSLKAKVWEKLSM